MFDFDATVFEASGADHGPNGHPNQVGVGEFGAGTFFSIIEK